MVEYTESKCVTCAHSKICMFKQDFICSQKAIDELVINLGDMRIKSLLDLEFIKPVTLDCVHYYPSKKTIKSTVEKKI